MTPPGRTDCRPRSEYLLRKEADRRLPEDEPMQLAGFRLPEDEPVLTAGFRCPEDEPMKSAGFHPPGDEPMLTAGRSRSEDGLRRSAAPVMSGDGCLPEEPDPEDGLRLPEDGSLPAPVSAAWSGHSEDGILP